MRKIISLIFIFLLGCSGDSTEEDVIVTPVLERFTLSVSSNVGGTVNISGGEYTKGTSVTITATPDNGYVFSGWTGDLTSSDQSITITINSNKTITANFEQVTYSIPDNFSIESEYLAPGTYYSINLLWDHNDDTNISSINIYRGSSEDNISLFKTIPNFSLSIYEDKEVTVRKEYFYSISYNYNTYEHDRTSVMSIYPDEPTNDLSFPAYPPMPRGIHYAAQYFESQTFETIKHKFTIHQEPSNNGMLYYQFYQGVMNDTIGFYYGIQTNVLKLGDSPPWAGRGLIFSRWKTRDIENYHLAEDGWGQSAGYEGDFIGVRNSYDWGVGSYETEIKKDSSDNIGDWYSLKIRKLPNEPQKYIGSLRFETSSASSGIKSGGYVWSELFNNSSDGILPDWHVSVDDITVGENEKPNRIYTWYSEIFNNFSNIYTTNNSDIHFLMGPNVKNITPSQTFYWENN